MKQTLKEAVAEYIENHVSRNENASFSAAFKAGAEWQANQSPWISVEEQLPPVGVDVIHTNIDTGRIYYGPINKVGSLILGYTPYGEITATHYMVVPKFPFDEILEANRDVLERIKEKGD